jgi:uncharacterized membrane protein YdjX (TVP38/TMEM64 family)
MDEFPQERQGDRRPRSILRFAPILLIAAGATAVFATGANRYLSLEAIREHYAALTGFVGEHFALALGLYMLAYVAVTAMSLPGATVMSLLGGFLFGTVVGAGAVVLAATVGATIIFLAARTAFGGFLRERARGFVAKMEKGFEKNAFSYLLLLRLIPLFPFFIVNVVPAFTKIRITTFVFATFIGIIPGAFAYVSAGAGLGAVFARGEDIELSGLLTQPEILTPIIALSVLALLPIIYRLIRHRRKTEGSAA